MNINNNKKMEAASKTSSLVAWNRYLILLSLV